MKSLRSVSDSCLVLFFQVILKLIADGAIQGQCADAVLDLTATLLNTTQCDLNNESVTSLITAVSKGY